MDDDELRKWAISLCPPDYEDFRARGRLNGRLYNEYISKWITRCTPAAIAFVNATFYTHQHYTHRGARILFLLAASNPGSEAIGELDPHALKLLAECGNPLAQALMIVAEHNDGNK